MNRLLAPRCLLATVFSLAVLPVQQLLARMKTNLLIGACMLLAIPSADALAVTLSIPADLSTQPGDTLSVPMFVSDGTSITDITIVLDVDFTRLAISNVFVNPALAGATFTMTAAGSGTTATETIVFHDPHALPSGPVELGGFESTVAITAPFGPTTLHFDNAQTSINGGAIRPIGTADGVITVVPEPSSVALLSLSSLSFLLWRRKSRKKHFGTASSLG
jgi:hypothetical protein